MESAGRGSHELCQEPADSPANRGLTSHPTLLEIGARQKEIESWEALNVGGYPWAKPGTIFGFLKMCIRDRSDPQPRRRLAASSARPIDALYARQVLFLTRAVPFLPATGSRPPSSGADLCAAIYATLCKSVLPESHRLFKLGGQGPIAQQSHNAFFGTRVPSR